MPEIIKKKIQKEARRYHVDEQDLQAAVNVLHLESNQQMFDAELHRENIGQVNQNLWQAAMRVQEFISNHVNEPNN